MLNMEIYFVYCALYKFANESVKDIAQGPKGDIF